MDLLPLLAHAVNEPFGTGFMYEPFLEGRLFGYEVSIYPWKVIGYFGVIMFALRWLPQMIASRRAQQVRMPRVFWIMSVIGSLSLLSYFFFGKPDSVGVLSNAFPCVVATYNLYLDLKNTIHPNPPPTDN
jgi:lipid-A-disaccharide synthase-like uncharacterized protein